MIVQRFSLCFCRPAKQITPPGVLRQVSDYSLPELEKEPRLSMAFFISYENKDRTLEWK
ncbi:hypothetical protein LBYZC6_32150 [Lacrimispora brassicae]